MAGMESIVGAIGTWFGFVGSCVAGGGTACRPFLAFVAITAAAGAGLALLVLAYRALQREQAREIAARRTEIRNRERPEPRLSTAAKGIAHSEPARTWHVAA